MRKVTAGMSARISGIFLQGLAVILPIALTIAVIYWLAVVSEEYLAGLVQAFFPRWRYWPGLGILVALLIVFFAGVLMNMWITRRLVARLESLLERIPLVKTIYGGLRDLAGFLSNKEARQGFKQVVAVRVADRIRLIGFVTVEHETGLPGGADEGGEPLVGVYLPLSYQIGGYTVFVPKSLVEPLDMPVEDAMRFTLTGGLSGGRTGET